jgi:hypothetical protein
MSTAVREHERAHDGGSEDYDTRHPCRSVIWDVRQEAVIVKFHWETPLAAFLRA